MHYTFTVLYLDKYREVCRRSLLLGFLPRKGDTMVMDGVKHRVEDIEIDIDNGGEITIHLDHKFIM